MLPWQYLLLCMLLLLCLLLCIIITLFAIYLMEINKYLYLQFILNLMLSVRSVKKKKKPCLIISTLLYGLKLATYALTLPVHIDIRGAVLHCCTIFKESNTSLKYIKKCRSIIYKPVSHQNTSRGFFLPIMKKKTIIQSHNSL